MARIDEAVLMVRKYDGSDGDDYFISFETPDEKVIFGFCRLRLTKSAGYVEDYDKNTKESIMVNTLPMLNNCAFIRELHVYGRVNRVNDKSRNGSDVQHRGFGRKLIEKAEEIAQNANYTRMAIISGVGVREYYRKFGYNLEGAYMTKQIIVDVSNDDIDIQYQKMQLTIIMLSIIVYLIIAVYNKLMN
jgi:elongator complex protein 3